MWNRAILKSNARAALTGRYGTAYAACVIAGLLSGLFSFLQQPFTARSARTAKVMMQAVEQQPGWNGTGFLAALFGIFVGLPLAVGLSRFFVQNRFGVTDIRAVFSGFRRCYGNTVGAMFVTKLLIILWTFLLIVPGIVKSLEYCMVPFILSDNPSMPGSRARQISSMMTAGEKGSIFVLGLSFIGWFALVSVPCSFFLNYLWPVSFFLSTVVIEFVVPYWKASFAELYVFQRDRIIQSGMVRPEEFGLVTPSV
jgi:uncharacterized membrane protein